MPEKPNNERPADLAVQDSVGGMAKRLLNPAHLRDLATRSVHTLQEQGAEQLWRDVKFRVGLALHHDDWRHRADIPLRRELKAQRVAKLQGPTISIIVPLYNTPAKFFDEMLKSVIQQTYTHWELVLVDASDAGKRLESRLPKAVPGTIVYEAVENGGIAANTTRGFELAHGDFIALLDHDDVLYPNALFEVVQTLQSTGADRRGFLGDHMAERETRTALRNAAAAVPDQRCRCGPDEAGGAGAGKGIYPRCGKRRVGRCVRTAGMESGHRLFQQRDRPLGAVSGVQAH